MAKKRRKAGGVLRSEDLSKIWKKRETVQKSTDAYPPLRPTTADLIQEELEDKLRLVGYIGNDRFASGRYTPDDLGSIETLNIGRFKQ